MAEVLDSCQQRLRNVVGIPFSEKKHISLPAVVNPVNQNEVIFVLRSLWKSKLLVLDMETGIIKDIVFDTCFNEFPHVNFMMNDIDHELIIKGTNFKQL